MTLVAKQSMTRRYIMIGAPVTTVRTPTLLVHYLKTLGIDAEVIAQHVEIAALDTFMQGIVKDHTVDGLMVTMPHKQAMLRHVNTLESNATRSQSINAVKRLQDGSFCGAQFDGSGLVNAVLATEYFDELQLKNSSIWLKGLGGAGLSIALTLAEHGCRRLYLYDSDSAKLAYTLDRIGIATPFPAEAAGHIPATVDAHILINATPLGMNVGDISPFSERQVRHAKLVADIVADPPKTALSQLTRHCGVALISGRDMVNAQVPLIGTWLI